MKRWRRAVVAAGLLTLLAGVAPPGVGASDPVTTMKSCSGEVFVQAYRYGKPVLDELVSFHMSGQLFCNDSLGRTGYKVKVLSRQGRIQGTGRCVDRRSTEPGDITVDALVELEGQYRNETPRWHALRWFTGRSTSPVPGGGIKGQIRTSAYGLQVGKFAVQPTGAWNNCAYSFQSLRLYNVLLGPAPAG